MKVYTLIGALCLMLLAVLIGCEKDSNVTIPQLSAGPGLDQIDELHNLFLEMASENIGMNASGAEKAQVYTSSSWAQKVDTGMLVANQMLTSEGLEPITRDQAEEIMLDGRQTALSLANSGEELPESLALEVLGEQSDGLESGLSSISFYRRYVELRVTMVGMDAFEQTTSELGEPILNTNLSVFMNTMAKSDSFWCEVFPSEMLPDGSTEKSWLKFVQFIAVVAVDAGSGALAGAGYGAIGGPGGSAVVGAVGAVVGGLSSWGAGDIMN